MKVSEIRGALKNNTDADKRLVMHLEVKLRIGYLKFKKVLSELK
jgi:hypothetical protein